MGSITNGRGWAALVTVALAANAGCLDPTLNNIQGEDFFDQAPNNEVDILFVVDDSGSMREEQQTLAAGFSSFAAELETSGTDFHIGVISTSFDYADPERGTLRGDPPFLTSQDDYVAEFRARAQVGISGSDKEKGLEAAAWALSPSMTTPGGPNAGFLREDAALLIVFVSDEEDCSDQGALEGQPAQACYRKKDRLVPEADFVNAYESLKASPERVLVGAIVGVEEARSACQSKESYPSDRYSLVANLTGGLVGDICLSDWSQVLSDLGLNASGTRNSFQLSSGAKESSIKVWVTEDGEEEEGRPNDPVYGWSYNPDTWFITFGERAVPGRGATIRVTYTVDPSAEPPGKTVE